MTIKEKIFYYLAAHSCKWKYQRFWEKRLAQACGYRAADGGFAYSEAIRLFYKTYHGLEIGYGTFGGCWLNSDLFWRNIKIGRYCSTAGELAIYTRNHPMDMYTTHPIAYSMNFGALTGERDIHAGGLEIGNGVWLGARVLIMPGCRKIGNGAIVGGGAVVTHDVPPYAIVAGNPARIIRYRFTEDTIKRLEDSRWWENDKDTLSKEFEELNQLVKNQ